MGGGIFGLSIAWAAVRRGARVRLIETRAIGAGSSGGLVGALCPACAGKLERQEGVSTRQPADGRGLVAGVARPRA